MQQISNKNTVSKGQFQLFFMHIFNYASLSSTLQSRLCLGSALSIPEDIACRTSSTPRLSPGTKLVRNIVLHKQGSKSTGDNEIPRKIQILSHLSTYCKNCREIRLTPSTLELMCLCLYLREAEAALLLAAETPSLLSHLERAACNQELFI